ncbi:C25 family cysteine peptidase [Dyadobacter endophyticus]|uniref:C25 family cysteine peptidase n=1 Tax=Dyadobacter endophyticus TaxID=1749036 RepID=UPI003CFB0242
MTRIFTHTLPLFCCICWHIRCHAQDHYGNEWIDYKQMYLRIPVAETGIYKITAAELARQGILTDSILISGIQLFAHGGEVPIEVAGEPSGKLGRDGYILFSGKKNDGYSDTALYTNPEAMPHHYYNLYSDTTAYFLTWQNGKTGLRTSFPAPGTVTDSAAFHWEEALQLFTSHYLPGRFFPPESNYETGSLRTAYDEGEGWTGPEIAERTPLEIVLKTNELYKDKQSDIACEILLAGWSPDVHSFVLWVGNGKNLRRRLADLNVIDRETKLVQFKISIEDFDQTGRLIFTLLPMGTGGHVSLSYARMRYPQVGMRIAPEPMRILPLRPVRFTQIDPEIDYLIITHPLMRALAGGLDPVAEYTSYRASKSGGGYKTAAVYSHEVFDQFNAGQPGPQGIRNAIRWLHDKGNLKFALLAGRSVDPQKARKVKDSWQIDMVPNAGWPGSDVALAMRGDFVPLVPIGRINALNSQQLLDYLHKVQAMEAEPSSAAWRSRVLHLSGGRSRDELNAFRSYVQSFEKQLENTTPTRKVATISKLTDSAVEAAHIDKQVNEGVALITAFGHSSIDVTDIDIGRASDPGKNYRNHPRYPAVIVNGCAAGSIFYSTQTLSSDWIFAPESGAVLFLAHTFNGPSTALRRYTGIFYEVLADSAFTNEPFGRIQREAIRRNLSRNPGIQDSINVQQMTLHGDPAIRIFPASPTGYDSEVEATNIPPLMQVSIDRKQLINGEVVSGKPVIGIRIFDDTLPDADNDTTMVAIWLKKQCDGCTDARIPLRNAIGKNGDGKFYEITLEPALVPGKYLLTIQCRDKIGLSASPYQIHFEVPDHSGLIEVVVAPNPSGQWFRFTIQNRGVGVTDLEITIRNSLGTKVFRKLLHCYTGRNEYFWTPAVFCAGLPAGVYHYTINPAEAGRPPAFPFEGVRGHLLYTP